MTEHLYDPPQPLEKATALSVAPYTDHASLEMEARKVFAESWQLVTNTGKLSTAGDHVVGEIAGRPIVIVRDEANALRAFHNICRHRAGPLATRDGLGAKNLRCKYHGWTYTLDGRLRAAPEMAEAEDFDPAGIRLTPVRVREWHGLVFVSLSENTPDFSEVYGGVAERVHPVELGSMVFYDRISYEVACNWKVYVDNFLEGYHLPHVHPGLSKVLDYRAYSTELFDWYSLQHSPLVNAGDIYGDGEAWYFFIYPNTMLNIMPGRMQTNQVIPLGIDRCRIDFDYYYGADGVSRHQRDLEFSDEIQQEDIAICEAVQKGLASGAYTPGRLSPKRESGVWHFQNLLRRACRTG